MTNIAYSALSPCFVQGGFSAQAVGPVTSSSLNLGATSGGGTPITAKKSYTLGSGAGQVGIASENIQTITASGSATIDLTAITEVLGTAAALTKIKAWLFWLLSLTDDTVNGTICTSVTVGGGSSNPNTLSLAGTTPTYTITNGGFWEHVDITAAGITVSGTVKTVKFTNNDTVNAAGMFIGWLGY